MVQEDEWSQRPVWTEGENHAPHWNLIPGPFSAWRVTIPTLLSQPTEKHWTRL